MDQATSTEPSHPTQAQAPPSQSAEATPEKGGHGQGSGAEESDSVELRMDQLRSFFLLDDITHTLALFALAIATPVWGASEFANLNTQLKQV